MASSIQRTPMPLNGQLFQFVLFQTRPDEYYLFGCCHHIAIDGLGMALVCRRIATIYSAMVAGEPIPDAYFGSVQDLVDFESEYEASADYQEDQAYWSKNLPPETAWDQAAAEAASGRDPYSPSASVQLDPSVVARIKELSKKLGIRRYSVITAACALLVRAWSGSGSEVALDFPVSRRVASGVENTSRDARRGGAAGLEHGATEYGCRFLPTCRHPNPGAAAASAVPGAHPRGRGRPRGEAGGESGRHQLHPVCD